MPRRGRGACRVRSSERRDEISRGTESAASETAGEPGGAAIAVCPKCLAELRPAVDFCPKCRGPVTAYANSGYYESALSEGWSLGESVVAARPRLVTLVGLWLSFLPMLGVCLVFLFFAATDPKDPAWLRVVVGSLSTSLGALFGWCLVRGTRNFLRERREGNAIDPDDGEDGTAGGAPQPDDSVPPST